MTAQLAPDPVFQWMTTAGTPAVGYQLFTYAAGTVTPLATYIDSSQTTQNTNPVILNSAGFAIVWLDPTKSYKFVLQDAAGNQIFSIDNIAGAFGLPAIGANLLPSITNTFNIGSPTFTWANGYFGTSLTVGGVPIIPLVQTANETTVFTLLGGSIANYSRPVGDVDRYVNNAVPGTTDCTLAFNIACAVQLILGGEVTFGYTSQYLVTGVINCTVAGGPNQPGITIRGLFASNDANYGILAAHNLMSVFDCTGNDSCTFLNVSIRTKVGFAPTTGILTARNSSNGSVFMHMTNVKIVGAFLSSCYYNYASEDDVLVGCYFGNTSTTAGTKCATWTAANIANVTSVVSGGIATGSHSCIDHTVMGCQFFNSGGNAAVTTDCIYLEAVENFHLFGGWAHTAGPVLAPLTGTMTGVAAGGVMTVSGTWTGTLAVGQQINGTGVPAGTVITSFGTGAGGNGTYNISSGGTTTWGSTSIIAGVAGRALVYVDMTNAPTNFCQIIGMTGEVGTPNQNYGVLFSNNAQSAQGWLIDSCKFPNAGNSVSAGPLTTCIGFHVRNISTQVGYGVAFNGTLSDSRIDSGYLLTVNQSTRNSLTGDTSQWTVTTRSHDSWYETGATNRTFAPGIVSGSRGWTATGAITQTGILDYVGNQAFFTITVKGATNIAAGVNATIILPFQSFQVDNVAVCDSTGAGLGFATLAAASFGLTFPTAITVNTNTIIIKGSATVS